MDLRLGRERSALPSPLVQAEVRVAGDGDWEAVGELLHAFNREFDEPAPEPVWLAQRLAALQAGGDTAVLVAGDPPVGLAVLRFRPSIWSARLESYLAELYVVPALRGRRLGRALMHAALDHARERGADYMDLGTSESDIAARALYESFGFRNREGRPDGPIMYVYELSL